MSCQFESYRLSYRLKKSEAVAKYSTTLRLLGSMCHKYDDHFCSSLIMKHNLPILSLFKKFEDDGSIVPRLWSIPFLYSVNDSFYCFRKLFLTNLICLRSTGEVSLHVVSCVQC
eukprot:Filipodium_phascolosomae@DN2777_c1_g2_i13.p1